MQQREYIILLLDMLIVTRNNYLTQTKPLSVVPLHNEIRKIEVTNKTDLTIIPFQLKILKQYCFLI